MEEETWLNVSLVPMPVFRVMITRQTDYRVCCYGVGAPLLIRFGKTVQHIARQRHGSDGFSVSSVFFTLFYSRYAGTKFTEEHAVPDAEDLYMC